MKERVVSHVRRLVARLHGLLAGPGQPEEFDEEIKEHLRLLEDRFVAQGIPRAEAALTARRQFGNTTRLREDRRALQTLSSIEALWLDLRYALRTIGRAPGFAVVSIVTLGLGIGATTAVFAVINAVLLRPLPYPDSEALVSLTHTAPGANLATLPMAVTQYFTYRDENTSFEAMGLWSIGVANLTDLTQPEEARVLLVSHGTLQALRVHPVLGRWFSAEDDTPESPETVLLTHGYWRRRFGAAPTVLGTNLNVDGRPRQVVGIMPERFRFLNREVDIILPLRFGRSGLFLRKPSHQGLARLKPGVTMEQANADVARMIPLWLKSWQTAPGIDPKIFENARFAPALRPLKQDVVGDIGRVLWILLGTVGVVLLVACANVANLMLVRAEARQPELALRVALGAGRGRIACQWLVESVLLGLCGGVLGALLASAGVRLLVAAGPATLPRLDEIHVSPSVLAFALALSLFSGVFFGFILMIRSAAPRADQLQSGKRSSLSRRQVLTRNVLVVAQVALALVLLVAAGLMIRTFQALRAVQPGFSDPDRVQFARLVIPPANAGEPATLLRVQRQIRDSLAAIPGVSAVAFASFAPLEPGAPDNLLFIEGQTYAPGQIPPDRRFKFVSPGFFQTVGSRLIAGRDLAWSDLDDRTPVAIVSENLAREVWRDARAALGRRIRANASDPWREIVGVVGDIHDDGMHEPAPTTVYWPVLVENFWRTPTVVQRAATFMIRSPRAGSESLLSDVRSSLAKITPDLPVAQVRTLSELYRQSLARTSFTLVMLMIAGATALLLGVVGIYGIVSYTVALRTRELGIRMALGAQHGTVRRMFLGQGLALAAIGVVCGVAGAIPLVRLMSSLLFGVGPLDPATYAAVCGALLLSAALASYVPAYRASAVDPVRALRAD